MLSPYKIKWLDKTNINFNLLTELSFDSDNGEIESFLNREAVMSESFDGRRNRVHSYKYNSMASPKITFIKNDFKDFTRTESRDVLSWLTGSNKTGWLSVYESDTNNICWELCGNFTEIQQYKLANGRVVGYTAIFEGNTPYMFSPINTITSSGNVTVNCQSDEFNEYIYPKIKLIPSTNCNIRLRNTTTNTTVDILDNIANETVTIDGANKLITSSRTNRTIGSDFSWNWLPIQYGNNSITVSLFNTVMPESTGYVSGTQYFCLESGLYKKVSIKNVSEYNEYDKLYIADYWTQQNNGTCSIKIEWRDIIKIGDGIL